MYNLKDFFKKTFDAEGDCLTQYIIPKNKEELKILVNKNETNLGDVYIPKNITDLSDLFYRSERTDFSGLEAWDVSHIENMMGMFWGCKSFTGKGLEFWDTSSVKTMDNIFRLCENFDGKEIEEWNVSSVETMNNMFYCCDSFCADLSRWDLSNLRSGRDMFWATNLESIPNNFQKKLKHLKQMHPISFDKESNYSTKEASLREQENSQKKVFDKNKIIIKRLRDGCIIPKNKEELEMLVNKLETNLADIVIPENITDLSKLFYKSNRADFTGLENWDVSHIKNMSLMFYGCRNFTGREIEGWDIRSVQDFSGTFKECKNFNPDLSKWQINAKNFDDMFSLCENFTGKGLEHWDIAKMQDMSNMFFGCKNFTGKSLEFWDTKFVKIMNGAFYGCQKFNADLSQWKLDGLRKAIYVFGDTDIRNIPNNFLEKFKELPAIEAGQVGLDTPERYYGID